MKSSKLPIGSRGLGVNWAVDGVFESAMRKVRAVDDVHVDAGGRECECRRRAGRAPSDDEHFDAIHERSLNGQPSREETAGSSTKKIHKVVVHPR